MPKSCALIRARSRRCKRARRPSWANLTERYSIGSVTTATTVFFSPSCPKHAEFNYFGVERWDRKILIVRPHIWCCTLECMELKFSMQAAHESSILHSPNSPQDVLPIPVSTASSTWLPLPAHCQKTHAFFCLPNELKLNYFADKTYLGNFRDVLVP